LKQTRRKHNPDFKAKVALAAIRGDKTLTDLAIEYGVHTHQIQDWKKLLIDNAGAVFEKSTGKVDNKKDNSDVLLRKIGQLQVEKDFLAQKLGH